MYKVELQPDDTLTIPTGWIHAVHTPEDALVFGGNYLHSLNIDIQLAVYRIELATRVPQKYRFPHFVRLCWMVAQRYVDRLSGLREGEELAMDLGRRVLLGLKELAALLVEQAGRFAKGSTESAGRQATARKNVPWDLVPDPAQTVRTLRLLVMGLLGEEPDELCFEGARKEEVARTPAPRGTKRKKLSQYTCI